MQSGSCRRHSRCSERRTCARDGKIAYLKLNHSHERDAKTSHKTCLLNAGTSPDQAAWLEHCCVHSSTVAHAAHLTEPPEVARAPVLVPVLVQQPVQQRRLAHELAELQRHLSKEEGCHLSVTAVCSLAAEGAERSCRCCRGPPLAAGSTHATCSSPSPSLVKPRAAPAAYLHRAEVCQLYNRKDAGQREQPRRRAQRRRQRVRARHVHRRHRRACGGAPQRQGAA